MYGAYLLSLEVLMLLHTILPSEIMFTNFKFLLFQK